MKENQERTVKLPYDKPELQIVELAADEVLEVGCKTSSSATAMVDRRCNVGGCSTIGS